MSAIVAIYHAAAREHRVLRERPILLGALYGAAWFVLLHLIVVPLFSAHRPSASSRIGTSPACWRTWC